MGTYIPRYEGFVADVANLQFKRADGKRYFWDKASATEQNANQEATNINGGWSLADLCIINGRQSLEMTFTSAAFSMDLFEAANAVNGVDEKAMIAEAKKYDVVGGTIVLPYKVDAESIYINGLEKGETAGEGVFTVEVDEELGSATITFGKTDVADGDQVEVFFEREVEGVHTLNMTTTNPSARGSLTARWPVYAGSDDGAESAIKGYVEVFVPLCRVNALPGFSTSYKSASTFALGFTAMDAGRSDGLWYTIRYIPA